MITNRNSPHVTNLIDGLRAKDKADVGIALDKLANQGLSPASNPTQINFNTYKIAVGGGNVEIILQLELSGDMRIVDIRNRATLKRILQKIAKAIEIGP